MNRKDGDSLSVIHETRALVNGHDDAHGHGHNHHHTGERETVLTRKRICKCM